jgi:hypothetical protein
VLTTVTGDGLLSPLRITREPVTTIDVIGVAGVDGSVDGAGAEASLCADAGAAMASMPAPQTSRSCSRFTLSP